MSSDTLVLAEWYDWWIPPRHHMSVVEYGDALAASRRGYAIAVHPLDPEMLINERRTAAADRAPSARR